MAREMKDSGIPWIGAIPSNWEVQRTKHKYTNHKVVAGDDADSYDRLALTLSGVIKRPKDDATGLQPEAFNGYQILKKNELVFKLIDLTNVSTSRVGYSHYTGIVSPAYIVLSPKIPSESHYGVYFFLSMWQREIFNHMGDDGVRSSLNASDLLNIPYLSVPQEEQMRIISFLDRKCAEIDSVIANTQRTIEEYKALKQSIITEGVTKGVRGTRLMKASGVEWVSEIPAEWEIIPSKYLFKNSDERRRENDVMLTASQKYGIISQEEYMERENSKIVLANKGVEDWKHVEPNDFIISLRSFQGGLEMSETTGCITWHYIVLKACRPIHSKFYKWLFKSEAYIKALQRTCNYIRDGQDLRYSNFAQVPLFDINTAEQIEIAEYLDKKCADIDTLIATKQKLLSELESYKKSLIYEYVTGKKEVPAEKQEILTVNPILLKALLYAKAQEMLGKNCRGRIQIQKILFMIECMYDTRIGSKFVRQKFGPLDVELDAVEAFLTEQKWLKVIHSSPTSYCKMENYKAYHEAYEKHFGQMNQAVERIIRYFENMRSSQAERFATLMAAWNDFLLDGNATPTDDELIREVRTNWHSHKENFKLETWQDTLQKMRAQHFEPHGYVSHTTMPE